MSGFTIADKDGKPIAYVIKNGKLPDKTAFLTPPECGQQVGYIVYPAGSGIKRHYHNPIERSSVGTVEVLYVIEGHCVVELYDDQLAPLTKVELLQGDIIIIMAGGHEFHMVADTKLLEVKPGPYPGVAEKVFF